MELALIKRIADIINERRTWINAELSPKQTPYLIPLDGTISVCYSCSLNLQVIEARNGYKKNQKWIIPEPSGHRSTKWLQKKSEVDNTRSRTGEICQKDKGSGCRLLGTANHWANELSGRGTSHSRCHLRYSKTHTR